MVLAAQTGNQQAFNLICRHYYKSLLCYAFKVCNDKEIARDAVQDAWLKLSRNIQKLEDPRAFRSWLYRLVRWCAIDLMRESNRYKSNEETLNNEQYFDAGEENNDESESINLAINRLPSIEKQMIHLFYLEELKISEIALVLDIPTGTVKSRLKRARELLRQKFNS